VVLIGITAGAAKATATDPLLKIAGRGDPTCSEVPTDLCLSTTTMTGTLTEVFGVPQNFIWQPPNGTDPLNQFTLDITGAPAGVTWQCQTDIWIFCSVGFDSTDNIWSFNFFDSSFGVGGPCASNGAAGGTCPGFLPADEEAAVTETPLVSETPEPGTIILFATGLILFFVGSKRRVRA
jgi:hypothetical protein